MSISGHKLGAPKGVGVLYADRRTPLEPLIHGGGQESGRRSGTENVAAAVGLAKALELVERVASTGPTTDEVAKRRDAFIARVLDGVPSAELTGHPTRRLPGSASFVFPGRSGESILLDLERRGIVCSSGSACAAGSDEPSHVLTAMGYDREVAQTAVRFTFGRSTTEEDLDQAAQALADVVG
jgi:cysteine desulfurase